MWKLYSRNSKKKSKKPKKIRKYIPHIFVVAVCAFFIAFGVRGLLIMHREEGIASEEYEKLREIFTNTPELQEHESENIIDGDLSVDEEEADDELDSEAEKVAPLTLEELARINQDFIGWISVKNHIEYPVVRGADNDKYIHTTFSGGTNSAGAIFMDYRNSNGFNDQVTIIYGHRTRNRTMFSPLVNYLNSSFLQNNQIITITTRDGVKLTYRIFAAKMTDAWDDAYTIGFIDSTQASLVFPGTPPVDTNRFLLLSTCTPNPDRDERIIVYAVFVD